MRTSGTAAQNPWIFCGIPGMRGTTNTEGRSLPRRTTASTPASVRLARSQNGILPGGGPPALITSRAETLSAFERLDRPPKPTSPRDSPHGARQSSLVNA